MTTLYLLCGKIAAGKSTLARRLAERPATLLITMDHWMSLLFPTENRTIEDFARLSARLRAAMGPHVVDILRHDLSVVLDFPANTVSWRSWMRSLITEADVAHELHVLDVPDTICKERLRRRNADGEHPYQVSEENYDLFTSYFVPPGPGEGFNIVAPYALTGRQDKPACARFADGRPSATSGKSAHAEIGSRTETIKHMSSEGMTFRQRGILEIVSRIAAHPKPFHERSRAAVRRGRVRYDLRERERSKPVAKGQTGRLRRITAAPIARRTGASRLPRKA